MPLMVSMLKITVRQSMDISPSGMPSMAILRAVAHIGDHVAKRRWVAGHLQADIEAFRHAELLSARPAAMLSRTFTATRDAHLARQIEAERIHIGDHHEARPGVARDAPRP